LIIVSVVLYKIECAIHNFCNIIVEMLRKRQEASDNGEQSSEIPESEQLSCAVSDRADAVEPDDGDKVQDEHETDEPDGDKVQDEHETHVDTEKLADEDDGDNSDNENSSRDADGLSERRISSVNGDFTALRGHDSVATGDSDESRQSAVYKETESNDNQAATEMIDQCDSGHSSPYATSADDAVTDNAAGILL